MKSTGWILYTAEEKERVTEREGGSRRVGDRLRQHSKLRNEKKTAAVRRIPH